MKTRINKKWRYVFIAVFSSALVTVTSLSMAMYADVTSPQKPAPAQTVATLVSNQDKQNATSVELGRTCFPDGVSDSYFIGEFEGTHEIFQLWRLTANSEGFLRVNTLFGTACGLAYDSRYDRIYSDRMSMDIARQMALLFYQDRAETLGGIANLQASIDERFTHRDHSHDGDAIAFPPEDLWALEQLGVTLPNKDYDVLEPEYTP